MLKVHLSMHYAGFCFDVTLFLYQDLLKTLQISLVLSLFQCVLLGLSLLLGLTILF